MIVQARAQPDRMTGVFRLKLLQLWDLASARARFARHLVVDLQGEAPPVAELTRTWPPRHVDDASGGAPIVQGLGVRLRLRRPTATAELDLGDKARFWPSDEALRRWRELAGDGRAEIVYEPA